MTLSKICRTFLNHDNRELVKEAGFKTEEEARVRIEECLYREGLSVELDDAGVDGTQALKIAG